MNNVLVIGTGTIGEPLIGLLSDFKKNFKTWNGKKENITVKMNTTA